MQLTPSQEAAKQQFLAFLLDPKPGEMRITGGPGVGKSFLTRFLLEMARAQAPMIKLLTKGSSSLEVMPTATTNKAARVLADNLSSKPSTIHSALGLILQNDFKTGATTLKKSKDYKVQKNVLVVIDEASFVDDPLLQMIRDSTLDCKVLFIGDKDQLAPVMASGIPVFDDQGMLECELSERVRFNGAKDIEDLVDHLQQVVRTGVFNDMQISGANVQHVDGPTFQSMIDAEYSRPNRKDDDAKILAWSNERVQQYNDYVRNLQTGSTDIAVGEHVVSNTMVHSGNHRISVDTVCEVLEVGGDNTFHDVPGRWLRVKPQRGPDVRVFMADNRHVVKAAMKAAGKAKDWSRYFTYKEAFADLRPLHACTVHKSQGSTYGTVFIDLADIGRCNVPGDVARLLYVACSRASGKVVLYGELPAKYRGGNKP